MAQNITLLGATYNDVPSVELPKSGGGTASFTDVTDTTAAAEDVASGKYFYTAAGVRTAGTGSGGGGDISITVLTVTIPAAGWSNSSQTVTVTGVTADNTVLVTYAPANKAAYVAADIYCTAQGTDSLTFACVTTPSADITANVMIIDGAVTPVSKYMTNKVSGQYSPDISGFKFYRSYTDPAILSDPDTEFEEGETVYFAWVNTFSIKRDDTSASVAYSPLETAVYSFEMPSSDITITLNGTR